MGRGDVRARRKFDQDFKEGAVRLVRETHKPIAQIARKLGIHDAASGCRERSTARASQTHPMRRRASFSCHNAIGTAI